MPLSLPSAVRFKGKGGSRQRALGVGSLCYTDLVRLHYPYHIIAKFSPPKKPKRRVFRDYFLK